MILLRSSNCWTSEVVSRQRGGGWRRDRLQNGGRPQLESRHVQGCAGSLVADISININFRKKAQPVNPAQLHVYKSIIIKIMITSPMFI